MELWHPQISKTAHTRESAHRSSRPLTVIPGNFQNVADDRKGQFSITTPRHVVNRAVSQRYSPYPTPCATLRSNDGSQLLHTRSYLRNPNYIKYLERKRFDNGKDGKPVWSDLVEESFQNAMAHIPPMGKNKKTQYGRPYGRNELIAEWIEQDTGEKRNRKQVSSHIQFLTKLLHGEPEWKALTTQTTNCAYSEDWHSQSIADQVRIVRQLANQAKLKADGGDTWDELRCRQHSVSRIRYWMWVAYESDMSKALHDYTRLSNELCTIPPMPLDHVKNWQIHFPDLESKLKASTDERFEIILLKSKVSLMSSFPPRGSKLGLILDLDFRHPNSDNVKTLSAFKSWSSKTSFYMYGKRFRVTGLKACNSAEVGVVKLVFEAEWWATKFTNLIQAPKDAEMTGDESAVATADEQSRREFRGLTIMQELFASTSAVDEPGSLLRPMAILLWTFRQSSKGYVGSTEWLRVVHDFQSTPTTSPVPDKLESSLPSLFVDSAMETSFGSDTTDHSFPQFDQENNMLFSPSMYETADYDTGLTPMQTLNSDSARIFDFGAGTGFTSKQGSVMSVKCKPFGLTGPLQPVPASFQPLMQHNVIPDPIPAAFQLPSNTYTQQSCDVSLPETYGLPDTLPTSPADRRQSLANFDISTHQMLQAQLGPDNDIGTGYEASSAHTLPGTDSRQSTTGHINGLDLDVERISHVEITATSAHQGHVEAPTDLEKAAAEHPTIFESPRVMRPPLLAHNSFAGVLYSQNADSEHEPLAFDTPVRNDFEKLMNNYQQSSPGYLFGDRSNSVVDQLHFPTPSDFGRPRSQPALTSNDLGDLQLEMPTLDDSSLLETKVEVPRISAGCQFYLETSL